MTASSNATCDMQAIDSTISNVKAAIEASRTRRKARLREIALEILATDRELPADIADLEGVLAELHELQIVAEYAQLKAVIYNSPGRVALLHARWVSCQTALEKAQEEYYAAASELKLPHHEHWDASAAELGRVVDEAAAALHAASEACAHEMTVAGEAKIRCRTLEHDYTHVLFKNVADDRDGGERNPTPVFAVSDR